VLFDERALSVYAWLRKDELGRPLLVVCNMTPVPRHGFRLGVPEGAGHWREVLNTDSQYYGGSNLGNAGAVAVDGVAAHGRAQSVSLVLPPLATIYLVPA
jgi:1,4-alpha-glucan branching enzyme